ncbi:hypothetical protein RchiOBHm_Chr2g0160981 [Rosa chinensis]|uniref:Uncharacterized protein n=1 Tax=Rosa chinensis TaxID=74649 RepID=A0A2P6S2P9_ROSCH|nr:hypothetical protein RchiOBHm_Chr2g0160981 [Rosa chinensis]
MKLGHEVHHLSHLLLELCNVLGMVLLSLKQSPTEMQTWLSIVYNFFFFFLNS